MPRLIAMYAAPGSWYDASIAEIAPPPRPPPLPALPPAATASGSGGAASVHVRPWFLVTWTTPVLIPTHSTPGATFEVVMDVIVPPAPPPRPPACASASAGAAPAGKPRSGEMRFQFTAPSVVEYR